jgi:hypothetical protein
MLQSWPLGFFSLLKLVYYMPNRILRDWTDSDIVDTLTVHAERFFTRLIMKVDDYGRYSANIKFLKSTLFPLKTDVRETDITRWITECEKSSLIALYNVANKDYLQIENFKQVLRQKNEKYPPPALSEIAMQTTSRCIADDTHLLPRNETKRNEVETEVPQAAVDRSSLEFIFNSFLEMRKKSKKPATELAIDLLKKDLQKLAPGDASMQKEIILQSIKYNWQGFFPLKINSNHSPITETVKTNHHEI